MVFLPLVKHAKLPVSSKEVYEYLLMIASFDIVPTDLIYFSIMEIPEEDSEEEFDIYNQIAEAGIESQYTIMNLGSLFLVFLIMLFTVLLLLITKPLAPFSGGIKKWNKKSSDGLFWNGFLRLFFEAILDLALASFINFHVIVKKV